MATKLTHTSLQEEIQVYHNDFFTGLARLVKKLFMF
jgi:hypothetical protein